MLLVFHGGKCCGIKTIYGLGADPNAKTNPLDAHKTRNHDSNGDEVKSDLTFFHEGAPYETCVERLKRYIDFMERRRPQNILEIALAESSFWTDQSKWFPVLLEHGFKEVTVHKNSNSGNTIHVFHLCINGKGGDEDFEDEDDDD